MGNLKSTKDVKFTPFDWIMLVIQLGTWGVIGITVLYAVSNWLK